MVPDFAQFMRDRNTNTGSSANPVNLSASAPPPPTGAPVATHAAAAATTTPPSRFPAGTLVGAHSWAYSRTDVLIERQLLTYNAKTIKITCEQPDGDVLMYMALPGTANGIYIKGTAPEDTPWRYNGKEVVSKMMKVPTLDLHSYPAAMSLCFRALQMASKSAHPGAPSVIRAIQQIQRDCTRQYEQLTMMYSKEVADALWEYLFYSRWTYMALERKVPTGHSADTAFLDGARFMRHRVHGDKIQDVTYSSSSSSSSSSSTSSSSRSRTDGWLICFKCGAIRDHSSPACPVASTTVSALTRETVLRKIQEAGIAESERQEKLRICRAYYDKLDRNH